ncbi:MAG: SEC-C metal-binding domain-containing protein [Pseudonocardia sp.]
MNEDRLRFLFGRRGAGVEPTTEDERSALLGADRRDIGYQELPLYTAIVNQILDGRPPQTWETARRLLDSGMARHEVMDELVETLEPFVERALLDQVSFDPDAYAAALARLPRPDATVVLETYFDIAREHVAIAVDELEERVAARLGLDLDDPTDEALLNDVDRELMEDPGAPLVMLPPDILVHAPTLADGAVLTHRLSATEHAGGHLDLDTDLAGFLRCPDARVAAGMLTVDDGPDGRVSWGGPAGWLADVPLDALLAVRASVDGEVAISVLDAEPEAPTEQVELLRAVYEAELDEPGMPVGAEDIVIGMLHRDPAAFAQPRPPLTELAAAAGLERRGDKFAHDEWVWERAAEFGQHVRLMDRLGMGGSLTEAMEALKLLAGSENDPADPADPATLRRALDLLGDPLVLDAVTDELLGYDDDPDRVAALVALADRLITAAGRSPRLAMARWVAAVAAERDSRVLDAEAHLRAASREAAWAFTEDRLAWYEADRGDAAAALRRWQALGAPADDPDLTALRPFAAASTPDLGRNQPCWCGSGRKFKQCHLGKPAQVPLPDRVGWLCRKSVNYVLRRGGAADLDLAMHAAVVDEDVDEILADQISLDVMLHEGGWLERFLADRGPLLPADEALLAASWLLVERSVHEIVAVRQDIGVTVRDLRTGEHLDVTDRALTRSARVGSLLCARVVPDGTGHQIIGAVVGVAPGRERALLDLLDRRDGPALLAWVAAASRPPELTGPDGEPLVDCTAVLHVPGDTDDVLGSRCDPTDAGWVWTDLDGRVLGMIELDGKELTAHALTEARMDALLADLAVALPGGEVVWQDRQPVEVGIGGEVDDGPVPVQLDPAQVEELQDRFERRWCDESVPALDGFTPRAAVADPTRRDDVERLIASFPEIDPATGAFGLRPERLRALLGLG